MHRYTTDVELIEMAIRRVVKEATGTVFQYWLNEIALQIKELIKERSKCPKMGQPLQLLETGLQSQTPGKHEGDHT